MWTQFPFCLSLRWSLCSLVYGHLWSSRAVWPSISLEEWSLAFGTGNPRLVSTTGTKIIIRHQTFPVPGSISCSLLLCLIAKIGAFHFCFLSSYLTIIVLTLSGGLLDISDLPMSSICTRCLCFSFWLLAWKRWLIQLHASQETNALAYMSGCGFESEYSPPLCVTGEGHWFWS